MKRNQLTRYNQSTSECKTILSISIKIKNNIVNHNQNTNNLDTCNQNISVYKTILSVTINIYVNRKKSCQLQPEFITIQKFL